MRKSFRDFNPRKKLFIFFGFLVMLLVVFAVAVGVFFNNQNANPYGSYIKINNYDDLIKNISSEYKDNIQAMLYNAVKFNSSGNNFNGLSVKDAYIRSGSANQQKDSSNGGTFSGSFVVDINSLKQSYSVQYIYYINVESAVTSGYPLLISCLQDKDVIFKEFKCKDLYGQPITNKLTSIVDYLPYSDLSISIRASLSDDEKSVTLYADFNIPAVDLSNDVSANRAVVSAYKTRVTDWIVKQGYKPTDYKIIYNYNDDGYLLN